MSEYEQGWPGKDGEDRKWTLVIRILAGLQSPEGNLTGAMSVKQLTYDVCCCEPKRCRGLRGLYCHCPVGEEDLITLGLQLPGQLAAHLREWVLLKSEKNGGFVHKKQCASDSQ